MILGWVLNSRSYSVWEKSRRGHPHGRARQRRNLGPITVDYATSNLTAAAGQDYQAISGTLAFQENETVKSLAIPILRDAVAESNEDLPRDA